MDRMKEGVVIAMTVLALAAVILLVPGDAVGKLKVAAGYALLTVLFGFGAVLVVGIATGSIDISKLLEELDGGASMSRFQLLVFTMVFAFSFFYLTAQGDHFPEIPAGVLTLLGISATTYGVSKGIQVGAGLTGEPTKPAPTAPSPEAQKSPDTAVPPPATTPPATR